MVVAEVVGPDVACLAVNDAAVEFAGDAAESVGKGLGVVQGHVQRAADEHRRAHVPAQ